MSYGILHRCRLERRLLGNVRYYTDYCLTHTDSKYMVCQLVHCLFDLLVVGWVGCL